MKGVEFFTDEIGKRCIVWVTQEGEHVATVCLIPGPRTSQDRRVTVSTEVTYHDGREKP